MTPLQAQENLGRISAQKGHARTPGWPPQSELGKAWLKGYDKEIERQTRAKRGKQYGPKAASCLNRIKEVLGC